MTTRHPIEYELDPKHLESGLRWVELRIKNVGEKTLAGLEVRLNSSEAYSLDVQGSGTHVALLRSGEETIHPFQVMANLTDKLYVSIDGYQEDGRFHWESPGIRIVVGEPVAELG